MADVIQQLRTEMNERINGRMDMLNSISTAIQDVSMKTNDSQPYRISDLIPRNGKAIMRRRIPKLHVRLTLMDASMVRPGGANLDQGLRVLRRSIETHWPWTVRKQNLEHSKPHYIRYCTGRQQMNH